MGKNLAMSCIALAAAVSAALPATASASPVLTEAQGGPAVAVGTKITATNVGNFIFREDGNFNLSIGECSAFRLTGEVTRNNGTELEVTITTATAWGVLETFHGMPECFVFGREVMTTNGGGVDGESISNGTPWCLTAKSSYAAEEFRIRGGGCNEAARKIAYVFDSTSLGVCGYERETAVLPMKGTYVTQSSGDAVLSLSPGANTTFKAENPLSCLPSTNLQLSMTLEKDQATASPLYIG
jgi:hypothetical protein